MANVLLASILHEARSFARMPAPNLHGVRQTPYPVMWNIEKRHL